MSHHLDSPIARQDIRLDITDLYLFRGQTGTAFVINVCHSIFGPIPVPGFHPEGMYEFKVDLNGDAVEDLTYRITFSERDQIWKPDAMSYVVFRGQRLPIRMPPAMLSRKVQQGRPSPRHPVCMSGPVKPATRSGLSPTYFMQLVMRFRTARLSISPGGIQAVRRTSLPVTLFMRLCLRCPMPCYSPAQVKSAKSVCGRSQRSRPTLADGARSIV